MCAHLQQVGDPSYQVAVEYETKDLSTSENNPSMGIPAPHPSFQEKAIVWYNSRTKQVTYDTEWLVKQSSPPVQ